MPYRPTRPFVTGDLLECVYSDCLNCHKNSWETVPTPKGLNLHRDGLPAVLLDISTICLTLRKRNTCYLGIPYTLHSKGLGIERPPWPLKTEALLKLSNPDNSRTAHSCRTPAPAEVCSATFFLSALSTTVAWQHWKIYGGRRLLAIAFRRWRRIPFSTGGGDFISWHRRELYAQPLVAFV